MSSTRQFLPMLPVSRPVEEGWKCKQSGDCCSKLPELSMTKQEAAHLVAVAPPEIYLEFRPSPNPAEANFVLMKAGPCPLFVFNGCLVYKDRPYNCRRFACMRPDPKTEVFELDSQGRCVNMWDRFKTSRQARRMLVHIQAKAQRWARKWGWEVD